MKECGGVGLRELSVERRVFEIRFDVLSVFTAYNRTQLRATSMQARKDLPTEDRPVSQQQKTAHVRKE